MTYITEHVRVGCGRLGPTTRGPHATPNPRGAWTTAATHSAAPLHFCAGRGEAVRGDRRVPVSAPPAAVCGVRVVSSVPTRGEAAPLNRSEGNGRWGVVDMDGMPVLSPRVVGSDV